ncbi:acyl-CoA dehydrogenase [Pseudoroseomonas wenyumeiae]|uniref:Acyl-CoA dehydrogenase n=1 Tax=Teichococcus wenyumeiae TaxID=2478470 RepID=A0A3A9JDW9_9PROT|nr:acyl-CoA dehydrogenase family protein [Pseudoroseomonas wenyumeiae]RKK04410.1 acyl-CoA dehydrogenase [Pseudoroseomonas wenyumeiae]RMI19330.1 acyl-CoA dehydrogenase [Pseudoroseomonas wenyumeiae]
MDSLLLRSAEELFSRHAAPASVRAIRAGGPATVLWEELENAGFLDALVPEAAGGIGLGPAGALPVLMAAGRFAVPLPVGETMLARAALAGVGEAVPPGAVMLAEAAGEGARVPAAGTADWVLLPRGDAALLLPMAAAARDEDASSPLGHVLRWPGGAGLSLAIPGLFTAGAWAEVAAMAGAMERILDETVRHAQDRQQFGRPVAAFQAVQQQISVMTEDVFATRMAAQLASVADGDGIAGLNPARIAAAKLRAGEAAVRVSAIAHAVHGAMGITEELDLHLLTERLRSGRMRFGGEAHWGAWLGRRFLASDAMDTLAFVQAHLGPSAPGVTA